MATPPLKALTVKATHNIFSLCLSPMRFLGTWQENRKGQPHFSVTCTFVVVVVVKTSSKAAKPWRELGRSGISCLSSWVLSRAVMRQYDGSKTNLMASDARLYAYKNVTLPKGYHVDLILKIQTGSTPTPILPLKKKRNQTSKIPSKEVMGVTKTNKSNKTSSKTLKPPKVRVSFN